MFFPGSRYLNMVAYTITQHDGTIVSVTRLPLPAQQPVIGFCPRHQGQRLDLIANTYVTDPTAFWGLCDANNAVVPDALATHGLIGIPAKRVSP